MNSKGFTLTEIVLVAGLCGGMALAVSHMFEGPTRQIFQVRASEETRRIQTVLDIIADDMRQADYHELWTGLYPNNAPATLGTVAEFTRTTLGTNQTKISYWLDPPTGPLASLIRSETHLDSAGNPIDADGNSVTLAEAEERTMVLRYVIVPQGVAAVPLAQQLRADGSTPDAPLVEGSSRMVQLTLTTQRPGVARPGDTQKETITLKSVIAVRSQ